MAENGEMGFKLLVIVIVIGLKFKKVNYVLLANNFDIKIKEIYKNKFACVGGLKA